VSALKELGAGVYLGKYSIKVNVRHFAFGYAGAKNNVAFQFHLDSIKVDKIIYFKVLSLSPSSSPSPSDRCLQSLSWSRVDVQGGIEGVRLSHVNVLSEPRVPRATVDVEACDVSLQLCWLEPEQGEQRKKSLFIDLLADNVYTSTDRAHDGWSPLRTTNHI